LASQSLLLGQFCDSTNHLCPHRPAFSCNRPTRSRLPRSPIFLLRTYRRLHRLLILLVDPRATSQPHACWPPPSPSPPLADGERLRRLPTSCLPLADAHAASQTSLVPPWSLTPNEQALESPQATVESPFYMIHNVDLCQDCIFDLSIPFIILSSVRRKHEFQFWLMTFRWMMPYFLDRLFLMNYLRYATLHLLYTWKGISYIND
jgi:hypothetical protein